MGIHQQQCIYGSYSINIYYLGIIIWRLGTHVLSISCTRAQLESRDRGVYVICRPLPAKIAKLIFFNLQEKEKSSYFFQKLQNEADTLYGDIS